MPTIDTASVRADLLARQAALTARAGAIGRHLRNADDELPQDAPDQAQARENDQVLERLDDHAAAQLADIRHALARLDDGSFGVCESCGDDIPSGRLAALPTATRCAACAD